MYENKAHLLSKQSICKKETPCLANLIRKTAKLKITQKTLMLTMR